MTFDFREELDKELNDVINDTESEYHGLTWGKALVRTSVRTAVVNGKAAQLSRIVKDLNDISKTKFDVTASICKILQSVLQAKLDPQQSKDVLEAIILEIRKTYLNNI